MADRHRRISVYVTALDGLVHVNSLFSGVVFLGLAFTTSSSSTASSACAATDTVVERLVLFEIISFSCFLFSTMVAYALKLVLHFLNIKGHGSGPSIASIHSWTISYGVMIIALSSWFGCVFLLLSMSHIIVVRLGPTSSDCSTPYNVSSITILSLVVGLAILIYFGTVAIYMWWSSHTRAPNNDNSTGKNITDQSQTAQATSSALSKPLIEEQA